MRVRTSLLRPRRKFVIIPNYKPDNSWCPSNLKVIYFESPCKGLFFVKNFLVIILNKQYNKL